MTNLVPSSTGGTPTYNGNANYPGGVGSTMWLDGNSTLEYAVDPAWTTLGEGSTLTVSCWARSTAASPGYARTISCMNLWTDLTGWDMSLQNSFTQIMVGAPNKSQMYTDISPGVNTAWRHFTATYTTTSTTLFVDGVSAKSQKLNALVTPTGNLNLGAAGAGRNGNYWTGGLDEIRIRRVTSSDDWVAAEYAAATDADYVTFGEVEEAAAVMSFEFGTPSVSSVSATGATISARLKGIGDNATSANLWVVVSGFGQTRAYPLDPATEPKVVEAALSGLQPGADWTAYLTATNNASPAANADSASVAFTTTSDAGAGSPGLYQDVTHTQATASDAAANWDIAESGVVTLGPLAMRSSGNNHDFWQAVDGTSFTWADNTGFGYAGYMYMEGGKDYYFGASADDAGYVWVDNGASNWDAKRTATQLGSYDVWNKAGPYAITETGYYRVVFASWNNSGGAGAEPTTKVFYPKLRYIALESGASAPAMADAGWQETVDPGDGSLFQTKAPTRAVSVLSAVRDGTLLSAKVALGEAYTGEASVLRYVYGATNGGNDPADWEGGSLVASSLPATAVTNDYIVGIAADTRYVRFYTQDGDALNWSATVSLDWASEGSIAGGLIFLGDPEVSSVVADRAVLSAVLNAPGEDATEAQSWFVVTGGGETKVVPAGTATDRTNLTVTVTGLTPETAYTFYATATNNAATPAGADSASGAFTTGAADSAWDTSSATFKQDGRTLKATVDVTNLGVGTTTLYLMTGNNWNSENTVSASQVITSPGKQTIIGDFSDRPWGGNKVYYSLMLVNGTAESATTNWPNASGQDFFNKSMELRDDSTYTWIGGSAGVWNVPANWEITVVGSLAPTQTAGYPVLGSTAIFATEEGDGPITVTVPATQGATIYSNERCWIVNNLNLSGMHEELIITSEDKTAADCRFYVWQVIANQTYNRLVFDDCNVYMNSTKDIGATAADANGENAVMRFTGGTTAAFNQMNVSSRPGFKFIVEDGATVPSCTGGIYGGSTSATVPVVLEIDNTAVTTSQRVEPDNANTYNGMVIRLSGANATLSASYMQPKIAASTNVIEYVIPSGGYSAVPVQTTHNTYVLGSDTTKAPMTLRIAEDSPGLENIPRRGTPILYSKGGINAANVNFEAKYNGFYFKDADGNAYADAAAIEAAGKTAAEIKEIWYRRSPAGTVYYIR